MLRVWCEHLPYEELSSVAVLQMLARWQFQPIVAIRPDSDLAAAAKALQAVRSAGLEPAIWPLLDRERGYWPSERNIRPWLEWTAHLLDELEGRSAIPTWVAADLEPPLGQVTRLLRRTLAVPVAAASLAAENMDVERYQRSRLELDEGVRTFQRRGLKVLGVTLPLAAHDLRDDIPLWQDMFETPWSEVGWDAAGIMAYGSIIAGASRKLLTVRDVRAAHQPLLRHIGRRFGTRAHASIGVTGIGVFGDEPSYDDPTELAADAAAARAAGVTDIAVFCLEGILARPHPEPWLRAVAEAPAREPESTMRAQALRAAGALARAGGRAVFRR